jgi:hypothetical protein
LYLKTSSIKKFHSPNRLCAPLCKGYVRVVAAASAVVADPNADVLDLGGLNLLDLVASAKGKQVRQNRMHAIQRAPSV